MVDERFAGIALIALVAVIASGCHAESHAPTARSGVLAALGGSGIQISADAEFVYAFEGAGAGWSRLYRIRRSGGEPELIVDVSPFGRGLAFCGERLVWSYAEDGARTMTELGSTDKRVRPWRRGDYRTLGKFADGQNEPNDVNGDGTWVYWTSDLDADENHKVIRRAGCSGGSVADIASASFPVRLASAPGVLVYSESGDRLMLRREGTPPRLVAQAAAHIFGLATDGVDAYWLEGKDPAELHAITLASNAGPRTLVKELGAARLLAVSSTLICWSEPGAVLCLDRAHLAAEPSVVAQSEWGDELYIPFTLAPGAPSLYAYVDRNVVAFIPPFATPRSPTRGNPLDPPFDASATQIRLRGIDLNRCLVANGPTGMGLLTIVYEPNGFPSTLDVAPPFQNSTVGACIMGLYRTIHVAPFHGRPKTLKHSFVLPWI